MRSSDRNDWLFRCDGATRTVRVAGNLRSNNGDVLTNAAVGGLGVIDEPSFLVYEALRGRRLVRVLPDGEADEFSIFVVYPNRNLLPPKVRSVIDFLVERFGAVSYWDAAGRRR